MKGARSPKAGQMPAPCLTLRRQLIPQESCRSADGGGVLAPSKTNPSSFTQPLPARLSPLTMNRVLIPALETMLVIFTLSKGFVTWRFADLLQIFPFAPLCLLLLVNPKRSHSNQGVLLPFLCLGKYGISHTHTKPQTIFCNMRNVLKAFRGCKGTSADGAFLTTH